MSRDGNLIFRTSISIAERKSLERTRVLEYVGCNIVMSTEADVYKGNKKGFLRASSEIFG